MSGAAASRRAGLLVPLFSCPSTTSWGIGDIGDVAPMSRWLADAGLSVLQLLPLNEMAPGEHSPYSAISAMAIDPIFICLPDVPDFAAIGGEHTLSVGDRARLHEVRQSGQVKYPEVRQLKQAALMAAFDHFHETEWRHDTARARALREFLASQAWWIEDYALFRAIHAREYERPWTEWPEPLQRREPEAIDRIRRELVRDVLFYQYLQWIAAAQWAEARAFAAAHGIKLFGDLPFMVNGDSADVWSRQQQFIFDASVGAPPDAFSETGQDWGVPVYRWDAHALEDFRWLRGRARRQADLYDGFRVDHLVGFYRTYARPRNGAASFFTPASEPEQLALGERLLDVFREPGAEVIAEDLGTIPPFVRESLGRLGVPGFCVFRWERHWDAPGQPFRDPSDYPRDSVAVSGTHDTEPQAEWWALAPEEERRLVSDLPTIQRLTHGAGLAGLDEADAGDLLLEALFASRSSLVLLPITDAFGWRDRINHPGTIGGDNWTFRLRWPIDHLDEVPLARERRDILRAWAARHGRSRAEA
jgi:4-alpha-glucanotransferase